MASAVIPPHNNAAFARKDRPSVMDLDNIISKDASSLPDFPLGTRPLLHSTPSALAPQQEPTDYFSYQPQQYHQQNPHTQYNQLLPPPPPYQQYLPKSPVSPYETYQQLHQEQQQHARYPPTPYGHPFQQYPPDSRPYHPHPLAQPNHYAPPVYSPSYYHAPPPPPSPHPTTTTTSRPTTPSAASYVQTPLKPKRKRASPSQLAALNAVFEETFFPSTQLRLKLARELAMTPRAVQIWFQNKRQAWRIKHKGQLLKEDGDDEEQMDDENGDSATAVSPATSSTTSLPGIAALTPLSPEARPDYFSSSSSESEFTLEDGTASRPARSRTKAVDMDVKEFQLRMPEGKGVKS